MAPPPPLRRPPPLSSPAVAATATAGADVPRRRALSFMATAESERLVHWLRLAAAAVDAYPMTLTAPPAGILGGPLASSSPGAASTAADPTSATPSPALAGGSSRSGTPRRRLQTTGKAAAAAGGRTGGLQTRLFQALPATSVAGKTGSASSLGTMGSAAGAGSAAAAGAAAAGAPPATDDSLAAAATFLQGRADGVAAAAAALAARFGETPAVWAGRLVDAEEPRDEGALPRAVGREVSPQAAKDRDGEVIKGAPGAATVAVTGVQTEAAATAVKKTGPAGSAAAKTETLTTAGVGRSASTTTTAGGGDKAADAVDGGAGAATSASLSLPPPPPPAWPTRQLAHRVNYGLNGKVLAAVTATAGATPGGTPAALRRWDVDASILPLATADTLLAARRYVRALSAAATAAARVALAAHAAVATAASAARSLAAAGGTTPTRSPVVTPAVASSVGLEKARLGLKRAEAAAEKEGARWAKRVATDAERRAAADAAASVTAASARFLRSFVAKAPRGGGRIKAPRPPPSTATPAARLIAAGGFLSTGDIDRQLDGKGGGGGDGGDDPEGGGNGQAGAVEVIDVDADDGSGPGGGVPPAARICTATVSSAADAAAPIAEAKAEGGPVGATTTTAPLASDPPRPGSPRLPVGTLATLLAGARQRRRSAHAGAVRRMGVGATRAGVRLVLVNHRYDNRPPFFGVYPGRGAGAVPGDRSGPLRGGRRPCGRLASIDYEVDSDAEWEEEEPGESLSAADDGDEEDLCGSDWDDSDGSTFIDEDDPDEADEANDEDDADSPGGTASQEANGAAAVAPAGVPATLSPDDVMDVHAADGAAAAAATAGAAGAKRKKPGVGTSSPLSAPPTDRRVCKRRRRRRRRPTAAPVPSTVVVVAGTFGADGGWAPPTEPDAVAALAAVRVVASPYARVEVVAGGG